MTIQSVEQALDSAIALLMYGSGAWFSYSLLAFIITRPRKTVKETTVKTESSYTGSISIEVMPRLMPREESKEKSVEEWVEKPTEKSVKHSSIEVTVPAAKTPAVPVPLLLPPAVPAPAPLPIVCEPVNWKKWKVDELRQASIAEVCGVRTSPIGSSRKLKKADLIAQYEQNLKRTSYEANAIAAQNEKIA